MQRRRLAAILVADVAGYSRLMEIDEAGTLAALKLRRAQVLQPLVDKHHGRIAKVMGDGVLIEFSSAVNSVACAVELQAAMRHANEDMAADRQILLRIGINLGDVIIEGGDLYGDGVNIAARLQQLAKPEGICISAAAYDQVKQSLRLDYVDIGEQGLKNIALPVRVYRIEIPRFVNHVTEAFPPAAAPGVAPGRARTKPYRPSIAVLPFSNLSDDEDQAFLCDGLTQDVTTDLSRFSNIFVIASHSAFAYRGRAVAAEVIGRELGVRYLLEGAVQRGQHRIRINLRLIDTVDEHHIWAHRFDVQLEKLGETRDNITQNIISMLAVRIDVAERERALAKRSSDLNAYEYYLRGAYCYSHDSAEELAECHAMFEKAVSLDPEYARAWGYLAYTTMRGAIHGWMEPGCSELALDYARKAVRLDSYDYANHWDLAFVLWNMRSFDQAMEEYRRALALNPNDADLLAEMGDTLAYWGSPGEAIAQLTRAMEINPIYPDWYRWNMGWALFSARSYEASLKQLLQIQEPHNNVRLILAADHVRLGNLAEARSAVAQFLEREPGYTLEKLRLRTAFRRPEDEAHWLDAVREAGLPE
jgi:adenylate cyclase